MKLLHYKYTLKPARMVPCNLAQPQDIPMEPEHRAARLTNNEHQHPVLEKFKMKWFTLVMITLAAVTVAACAANPTPAPTETVEPDQPVSSNDPTQEALMTPTPSGDLTAGTLYIDGIDVLMLESFPVQITVVVRGNLADGCTQIGQITQMRDKDVFRIIITAVRPRDAMCTEALVPFQQSISLDVIGLPKGKYIIDINGSTAEFELQADNILPTP